MDRTCAILHFTSAITMLAVGLDVISTAPVVTIVALRNNTALHIEHPPPVSLLPLLIIPSVISGLAHLVLYIYPPEKAGQNPVRWVDYAITSPIMVVLIALISGVVDVWTLWGMAAMQSILMIVSGYAEGDNSLWLTLLMALYYTITVWGPIFHAIAQQNVPLFVAWIILTLFVLFAAFGVVYVVAMYTNHKKKTDLAYATLSIAAKLSLQWLVYGGADSLDGEGEGKTIGIVLGVVFVISVLFVLVYK